MRNLGLDLLRAIAVLLVLGRHLTLPETPNWFLTTWQRGGWVGVDLFFVLSGFLVSSLLFREYQRYGTVDLKRFLFRRGFKIYPPLWVLLVFTVVMRLLLGVEIPAKVMLGEVFFLQNYLGGLWGHTWSLAVEEHFYIGIAILFAVWGRSGRRDRFAAVPATFLVIAVVCLTLRIWTAVQYPEFVSMVHLFGTQLRMDSLFFGVLLAYLWFFRGLSEKVKAVPSIVLLAVGIGLLAPAFVFRLETHPFITTFGLTLFYLGSGSILLAALRLSSSKSFLLNWLGAIGAASYSIYLWHGAVGSWGNAFVRKLTGIDSYASYLLIYLGGSCIFGLLMSRLVESPALKWRDALFPPRSSVGPMREASGGEASSPAAETEFPSGPNHASGNAEEGLSPPPASGIRPSNGLA